MKNEEIKNLKTILGLQQTNKYDNGPAGLRYGHVMIIADLCVCVGGWVGGCAHIQTHTHTHTHTNIHICIYVDMYT